MSVNRLVEELSTISIAQHDAETRFRALAARGSAADGLRILDAVFGAGKAVPAGQFDSGQR